MDVNAFTVKRYRLWMTDYRMHLDYYANPRVNLCSKQRSIGMTVDLKKSPDAARASVSILRCKYNIRYGIQITRTRFIYNHAK